MNRYEFIPSKDYRKYLVDHHVEISDKDFATVVYNNPFITYQERNQALDYLKSMTSDKELAKQIDYRLTIEKKQLKEFYKQDPFSYFQLEYLDETGRIQELYHSFENAYQAGLSMKIPFSIEKDYFEDIETEVKNTYGSLHYNKKGILLGKNYFYPVKKNIHTKTKLFEYRYLTLPYYFKQGDIVRILGTNTYGIVSSFKDEQDRDEYQSITRTGDYSDFSIEVELMFKDDKFIYDSPYVHDHVSPMMLECAHFDKNDLKKDFLEYMVNTLFHSSLFFGPPRKKERIHYVLERLGLLWEKYPDLRLGQLILNIGASRNLFAIEDEDLLKIIDEYIENK